MVHSKNGHGLTVASIGPTGGTPFTTSDFIAGPDGMYSLDPTKRNLSIVVTIPASPFKFEYSVTTITDVHFAPEPSSSVALAAFGFVGLMAWGWRRREALSPDANSHCAFASFHLPAPGDSSRAFSVSSEARRLTLSESLTASPHAVHSGWCLCHRVT